ncbi:hypothetical protein HK097_003088, partial [Rhizophlyctis rosea]
GRGTWGGREDRRALGGIVYGAGCLPNVGDKGEDDGAKDGDMSVGSDTFGGAHELAELCVSAPGDRMPAKKFGISGNGMPTESKRSMSMSYPGSKEKVGDNSVGVQVAIERGWTLVPVGFQFEEIIRCYGIGNERSVLGILMKAVVAFAGQDVVEVGLGIVQETDEELLDSMVIAAVDVEK